MEEERRLGYVWLDPSLLRRAKPESNPALLGIEIEKLS